MARWDEFQEETEEQARRRHEAENADGYCFPREDVQPNVFHTTKMTTDLPTLAIESRRLHLRLLMAVPLCVVAGLLIHWLTLAAACEIAAVLVILSIGSRFARGTPIEVRGYIILFSLIFVGFLAAVLLRTRFVAASLSSILTMAIFIFNGRRPIDFFHQWLFAAPGIRQDAWVLPRAIWTPAPSHMMLAAILLLMVVVPAMHSVTLALVLILLVCAGIIATALGTLDGKFSLTAEGKAPSAFNKLRLAVRFARALELYYVGYPDSDEEQHWKAPQTQGRRRITFGVLWGSMAVTTAISLSYCIPYEFFGAWFQQGFVWSIPPAQNEQPFEWMTLPLLMTLTARMPYLWALVLGAVLSFALPYLILLSVYMPALLRAHDAAITAEAWYRRNHRVDEATHFQHFLQQLWQSNRVHERRGRIEL